MAITLLYKLMIQNEKAFKVRLLNLYTSILALNPHILLLVFFLYFPFPFSPFHNIFLSSEPTLS